MLRSYNQDHKSSKRFKAGININHPYGPKRFNYPSSKKFNDMYEYDGLKDTTLNTYRNNNFDIFHSNKYAIETDFKFRPAQ